MMNAINHKTTINSLYRLIRNDQSHEFFIIVNVVDNKNLENVDNITVEKSSQINIKTTINKARVISSIINQLYQDNQELNQYEIKLNNVTEKNKTRKIVQAFQILFDSIENQVMVPEDVQRLFMLILNQLGEKYQQIRNNESENNRNNDNNKQHKEIGPINIINYYRNVNKKYPNSISKIKITAGNNEGQYDINNLFRYDTSNISDFYYKFFSHKTSNSTLERYIEFEFKEDQVKINSCKVETNDFFCNQRGMKIVGSNDHVTWDTLYECIDSSQLINEVKVFQCQLENNYYRIIRYIEINNSNHNGPCLKKIEVKRIEFEGYISPVVNNSNKNSNNESENANEVIDYSDLFTMY